MKRKSKIIYNSQYQRCIFPFNVRFQFYEAPSPIGTLSLELMFNTGGQILKPYFNFCSSRVLFLLKEDQLHLYKKVFCVWPNTKRNSNFLLSKSTLVPFAHFTLPAIQDMNSLRVIRIQRRTQPRPFHTFGSECIKVTKIMQLEYQAVSQCQWHHTSLTIYNRHGKETA